MNAQRALWLTTLLFLLFAAFSGAEPSSERQVAERTLGGQMQANVPQTPAELLQMFKDLLADPDVDGQEFCEKRLGIDRKIWRNSILEQSLDKKLLGPFDKYPSAPFQFTEAAIDYQGKLSTLELWFFENPNFLLTPALTRQILGEPKRIVVSNPKSDNSYGEYRIIYSYSTKKYVFVVSFHNVDEANVDTRRTFSKHTLEKIDQEKEYRHSFAVHKDYRPAIVELKRF